MDKNKLKLWINTARKFGMLVANSPETGVN